MSTKTVLAFIIFESCIGLIFFISYPGGFIHQGTLKPNGSANTEDDGKDRTVSDLEYHRTNKLNGKNVRWIGKESKMVGHEKVNFNPQNDNRVFQMYKTEAKAENVRVNSDVDGIWSVNGPAEREQLLFFWYKCGNQCDKRRNITLRHNATVIFTGNKLMIRIEEMSVSLPVSEQPSNRLLGGSGFRVELVGNECHVCPVRDFFNGTYIAFCPEITGCVNGTIYLDYTFFEAYRHHPNPRPTATFNEKMCREKQLHRKIFSFHGCPKNPKAILKQDSKSKLCKSKTVRDYLDGRWWNDGGRWRWGTNDGCRLEFANSEKLLQCQRGMSLAIMGDSHMRETRLYLTSLWKEAFRKSVLAKREKGNGTEGAPRCSFKFARYPNDTQRVLSLLTRSSTKVIRKRNIKENNTTFNFKKRVILFNFGIWSLVKNSAKRLLEHDVPLLIDFLGNLRQNMSTDVAPRMIYQDTLPNPCCNQDSNYYMTAAANANITRQLRALGVEVMEAFRVANPLLPTVCDTHHYLCYRNGTTFGDTGKTVAQILFKMICNI